MWLPPRSGAKLCIFAGIVDPGKGMLMSAPAAGPELTAAGDFDYNSPACIQGDVLFRIGFEGAQKGSSLDRRGKFVGFYTSSALILLNALLFFVLANAGLSVLFRIKDHGSAQQTARAVAQVHENASLRSVYPGMDAESIHRLITETWSRSYAYEPLTQFKERPFKGRFVNVSEAGFRVSKNQGPWPPDPENYNIFVFGGSTTFGYGVPDDQTIASYLQDYLSEFTTRSVRVYNFGRSSYISTQERVLFEQLLLAGFTPNMALFIDGLNEFAFPAGPAETERLRAVFDTKPSGIDRWHFVEHLPMTRLAHFIRRSAVGAFTRRPQVAPENVQPTPAFDDGKYHDPAVIAGVIARYFENKKLIETVAAGYGAKAVFAWQPIPLYKYDLKYHLFATGDFGTNFFARYGYSYIERRVQEKPAGENFLWCADIQESLAEPLYVDKVHYTAKMSRLIAATIGAQIVERGLLTRAANLGLDFKSNFVYNPAEPTRHDAQTGF
jgi:hypothetical protein